MDNQLDSDSQDFNNSHKSLEKLRAFYSISSDKSVQIPKDNAISFSYNQDAQILGTEALITTRKAQAPSNQHMNSRATSNSNVLTLETPENHSIITEVKNYSINRQDEDSSSLLVEEIDKDMSESLKQKKKIEKAAKKRMQMIEAHNQNLNQQPGEDLLYKS